MKTQNQIIRDLELTDAKARLFKAVMLQIGDWGAVCNHPEDYRNAAHGVQGFIYSETEKFAKRNIEDILEVLSDFEDETGSPVMPAKEINYLNWLAWFALESTIDILMTYKEERGL